ncbi:Protein of unknown function (DUF1120) [Herbaspirillum sp. YR522]|nr:Protein of unknown function (DUF1120) [Herbaspirillum sp. YR522]
MLAGSAGSAAAAAPTAARAGASARIQVTGSVIPGACTVQLASNGTVDYGRIPRTDITDDEPFRLAVRNIQFTVGCKGPMTIKVSARDENPGTAVLGLVPGEDHFAFGLGRVNDTNIGQFRIQALPGTFFGQDASGHTAAVDILHASASDSANARQPSWVRTERPYFWSSGERRQSFAEPGTLVPGSYRSVTGAFQIETYITFRSQLPDGNIPLAGLATIEIVYK